jgi:hypothetical protein
MNKYLVQQILAEFPNVGKELIEIAELRDSMNAKAKSSIIEKLKSQHKLGTSPQHLAEKKKSIKHQPPPVQDIHINDIMRKI